LSEYRAAVLEFMRRIFDAITTSPRPGVTADALAYHFGFYAPEGTSMADLAAKHCMTRVGLHKHLKRALKLGEFTENARKCL
jgi:hypothetical protein